MTTSLEEAEMPKTCLRVCRFPSSKEGLQDNWSEFNEIIH